MFRITAFAFTLIFPLLAGASSSSLPPLPEAIRLVRAEAPPAFEANRGQAHSSVQYLVRTSNFTLFLTNSELVAAASGAGFRMTLKGSDPGYSWTGESKLAGVTNYLTGRDPGKWITGVSNYAVLRRRAYPGIDMVLRGDRQRLEYQFEIAAHADPALLRFSFRDAEPSLSPTGDLVLHTPRGDFRHKAPVAYQISGGKRRSVSVAFTLSEEKAAGFHLGNYDSGLPLVIDPVISYYGFYGGSAGDSATAAAADPSGDLYVTGWTDSLQFPLGGSPYRDFNSGARDIFVSKLYPNGSFVWSTYIGGTNNDEATALAIDSYGNSYLTGATSSPDFPTTTTAFQHTYGGGGDAFLIKLNIEGSSLTYSSYLGGSGAESGQGVAADGLGYATFTGFTSSTDLPTRNARQSASGGGEDVFLFKLHANSSEVIYSTYFGGSADDEAYAVALDRNGDAYITGRATCSTLPAGTVLGPGGGTDIFVMKWKSSGDGAAYLTCAGGNGLDSGHGIAVDSQGSAYVTGFTSSTDFPVYLPLRSAYGGALSGSLGDAFVFKLNAAGTSLLYSTYLGGARDDWGQSIAVDALGSAFLSGITFSNDFPRAAGVPGPAAGIRSGFLARLSSQGSTVVQSYFFEGINPSDRFALALDMKGGLYAVGGASSNFHIPSAAAPPLRNFTGPVQDAFLAKLATARLQVSQDTFPATAPPGSTFQFTQRVVNRGPDDAEAVTFQGTPPQGMTIAACTASTTLCVNSASSFRVDLPVLKAGTGVEVNLSVSLAPNGPSSFIVYSNAASPTYDPLLEDNSLTSAFFTAAPGTVCAYALNTQALNVPPGGGFASVNVSAGFSCPWTASTPTGWITAASPGASSGNGGFTVSVAENATGVPRTGSFLVAGLRVLVLQQGTPPPIPLIQPFADVPAGHPFYDSIQLMRFYGVTTGCTITNYCPDAPTTRGQMAVFIVRALLGTDNFPVPGTQFFADVPAGHPQYRYIQKLRDLGITNGCTASNYCPDDPVTRGQMASFLIRGRLAVLPSQPFAFPNNFAFSDVPVSSPAYPAIQKMKELGITSGCAATRYCPDDTTTRGQMAVFLARAFLTP
ncbi:MAG: SBBP repeat-containing protein [Bryobacterales bacterium]|nr:SBBP repeat-containing protein [Bryobacterales bacterium]